MTASPSTAPVKASRSSGRFALNQRTPGAWIVFLAIGLFSLAMILPVLIAAMNSVKTSAEYAQNGPLALPQGIDVSNITEFWLQIDFTGKLVNSLLISLGAMVLGVLLSVLTSYAIGLGKMRGRFWILALFMIAFTLPQEALIYPIYFMAKAVGLYNTQISVVIVVGVLQSAFGIYLLSSVMATIPAETLEAAKIDGAGRFRILVSIVVPLMRPTIMVLATFFFIWTSVEAQADDPASSLQFYRAALRLRRELFAPGVPLVQRDLGEDLVAFRRGDVLVVGNLGDRPHPLPDGAVLLASGPLDGGAIPPDTTVWMRG